MTIVLNVAPDMEEQLRAEAARRGQSYEAFAQDALRDALTKIAPEPGSEPPRIPGLNEGPMWISDDFDAPLPDTFWLGEEHDL